MSNLFLTIYAFFENRRRLFGAVLAGCILLCVCFAARIRFDENIASFFDAGDGDHTALFDNLRIKDKIVVLVSGEDPDELVAAAERFAEALQPAVDEGLIASLTEGVDPEAMERCVDFIYDYLPVFLSDEDFEHLETAVSEEGIRRGVADAYTVLASASGMVIGDVVLRDPIHAGSHLLRLFEQFAVGTSYELYADRIFTEDLSTLLLFIDPAYGMGNTGSNDRLVDWLERAAQAAATPDTAVTCIGGPVIAVGNARQIKHDTAVTLSLALAIILAVILLSFRNVRAVPLIVLPPAFGALFALAGVQAVQGSVSAIAVGAGAVVLGISLSYSIHIISHLNHTADPRRIIEDLAVPLTIGCLTTIGAFAALIFTSSALLRDIGLFAVFTLTGTTLFSLIFLPHLLRSYRPVRGSRLLGWIERWNGYSYDHNRWVVLFFAAATAICLFFYNDVAFDSDMSNLNYMPDGIEAAEERLATLSGDDKGIYIVSSADDFATLTARYAALGGTLARLEAEGKIEGYTLLDRLVVAPDEQARRIERWRSVWAGRREATLAALRTEAARQGFRPEAFDRFAELIGRDFRPCGYTAAEVGEVPALREWIDPEGRILLSRILVDDAAKEEVYAAIGQQEGTLIVDRGWFSARMMDRTVGDFNYILLVSSLIVFAALLLSYGRLELTLLTFLPMCISWVIILGCMALFGVKFNIVNIILATFIFGIGDDFSIFIMDGLLQEYKTGEKILGAHKTAIFFSAFTAVVGMGVLIFAKHPALRSIAVISVLGLCVVVLVAYTVQPLLFRLFVSGPVRRGGYPYTIGALLRTAFCFLYFLGGCIAIRCCMVLLALVPVRREARKAALHRMLFRFTRLFLRTSTVAAGVRYRCCNPAGEKLDRPAMIIANHQSFIDILVLLSLSPRIVMVTNSWVWHSPFFGRIVRGADFLHTAEGYDGLVAALRQRVAEGYSVVVFPEGTRSADGTVGRFHKGAFWLAEQLGLDLLPVVLYGTGHVSSKQQGIYIKPGIMVADVAARIPAGDTSFGTTYQERAKRLRRWFAGRYAELNELYGRASNPHFRDALHKNYCYKGPLLEWSLRRQCRRENYCDLPDRLIPRDAEVVELGCGYGQRCFMLAQLAPARTLLGIDADAEKIALARHSLLCTERVSFRCADVRSAELPAADVFLVGELPAGGRQELLQAAAGALRDGGMIVVRGGDPQLKAFAEGAGLAAEVVGGGDGDPEKYLVVRKITAYGDL